MQKQAKSHVFQAVINESLKRIKTGYQCTNKTKKDAPQYKKRRIFSITLKKQ